MSRSCNTCSLSAHRDISIGVLRWRLGVLCEGSADMETIAPFFCLLSKRKGLNRSYKPITRNELSSIDH